MKLNHVSKLMTMALCSWLCAAPAIAAGDDIDIFTGASGGDATNPRILIVLDNSPNWSRASQGWLPKKTVQGDAEIHAIKSVVGRMNENISLGLMEFVTGPGSGDGGFIRKAIKPMNDTNRTAMLSMLGGISATDPNEKASQNVGYGDLMRSAYNYFAGGNQLDSDMIRSGMADGAGYTSPFTRFKSPLTTNNLCGKSYIIFIGNASENGPNSDSDPATLSELHALTDDHSQVRLPQFTVQDGPLVEDTAAISTGCYDNPTAAAAALTEPAVVSACAFYNKGCKVTTPVVSAPGVCPIGKDRYTVLGYSITSTATVVEGKYQPDTSAVYHADEWARMMAKKGVVVSPTLRAPVITYTIDVHKDKPDTIFSALLLNMATYGEGKYFKATSDTALIDALETIVAEIQATNSSFASTSLPVNATNRTQNENQVFIGMFRPDAVRRPRWFGNLKRYQLILSNNRVELGDVNGNIAANVNNGFIGPCAQSYWTKASGTYWQIPLPGEPVEGNCLTTGVEIYSDLPDGELVEKGAAAQILRQGNAVGAAAGVRTLNRQVKTLVPGTSGPVIGNFDTTQIPSATMAADIVNYIRGADVRNEKQQGASNTLTRPSIHGDVIHSRPLPVNYGAATVTRPAAESGVTVYYGANDGTLHAVDSETGVERWAFVAPEFFPRLSRLYNNLPLVSYYGDTTAQQLTSTKKDYFFDGSIGLYQNADSSEVYIYPSMRRGGRSVYALNATTPSTPVFAWKKGCPNLSDDESCDTGFSDIGQTWSTPAPAFVKGYSKTESTTNAGVTTTVAATPLVIFGGGYDTCEDVNALVTTGCDTAKGRKVYIVDSKTGATLKTFNTSRPVAADIAMVDVDSDGYADYAYATDTGGGIYRISFIADPTGLRTPLDATQWTMRKIAQMNTTGGRKFLFAPALLYSAGNVYVALASGDREHPMEAHYPYAQQVTNRFYVYRDEITSTTGAPQDLDALANYSANNSCNTPGALPGSTVKGWFIDLQNGRGEQGISGALITAGMVTFNTYRPNPENSGTCATALGRAHGYWLNLLNGSGAIGVNDTCGGNRTAEFVSGGMAPTPVMATTVPVTTNGSETFVTVVIGAVQRDRVRGNVAFSPQQIVPSIKRKRKRSYTYTAAE